MRCGVARVEPERRLEQLRHRRQRALLGKVAVVREPALANQEAYELLGGSGVLAGPEDREAIERGLDGERLPVSGGGPVDGHGVVVVVVRSTRS
jgi:hypothetical protein